MELILIRHSIAQGNRERRFLGVTDVELTPEGEQLAREIAPQLPPVEVVYTSPLRRCRRTAELLWPGEQRVVPGLRESDFGPFEGKNHQELEGDPQYQRWLEAGDFLPGQGGEPLEEVARRMVQAVGALIARSEEEHRNRVAVVSHGGALLALMNRVGAPKRESIHDWMCKNCSGWLVRVEPGNPYTLTVVEPLGRNEG